MIDPTTPEARAALRALEDEHRHLVHPEGDDACHVCDSLDALRKLLDHADEQDRENAVLRQCLADAIKGRDKAWDDLAAARRAANAKRVEQDALVARLLDYVQHKDGCAYPGPNLRDEDGFDLGPHDCTCGLDALLAEWRE